MALSTDPNESKSSPHGENGKSEVSQIVLKLGLQIGTPMTIETVSPPRKCQVKLIGFVEGRSVLISSPLREGKEVLLEKDNPMVVRLLEGKQICAFETKVIYRSVHPYVYYHLAWPEQIAARQIRDAERIDTEFAVLIDNEFDVVGQWPRKALLNNLSKSGARILATSALGSVGHEIVIQCVLMVSEIKKKLSLSAVIRNIGELVRNDAAGKPVKYHAYGVQFVNVEGDTRLALANYIYEHSRPGN